jgi:hypothetical protein
VVAGAASAAVDRMYRRKCLVLVERERCDLGVFGHNHRRHLVAGDRYANSGRLRRTRLEYLALDGGGASLREFALGGAAAAAAGSGAR